MRLFVAKCQSKQIRLEIRLQLRIISVFERNPDDKMKMAIGIVVG